MTSNEHISMEEWLQFFAAQSMNKDQMLLQNRVMTHISECEECKAFYDAAAAMQSAARGVAELELSAMDESAFRAVASASPADKNEVCGCLTICIDKSEGSAVFLEDTLECDGYANEYALSVGNDGKSLLDDMDDMALHIDGNTVTLEISSSAVQASMRILSEDCGVPAETENGKCQISLPDDIFLVLEITFTA